MPRRRSLWPREHGAYAQLASPMIAALVIATPTRVSALLAISAAVAFLANEPALVLLGHRGARMRAADGDRARARLLVLGAIAIGVMALVVSLASVATLRAIGIALGAASILVVLACGRVQHTLAGELTAAVALPAASVPVAIASGVEWRASVLLWLAWSTGYATSVVAVHRVIAHHRRAATRVDRAIALGLAAVLATVSVCAVRAPLLVPALPLVAISSSLVIRLPPATHLRRIGLALVGASLVSIALAVGVA